MGIGGRKVGTGYVPIKPDAAGFGDDLERQVGNEANAASGRMGGRASAAFGAAFAAGAAVIGKSIFDFAGFDGQMREVFTLLPDISEPAMAEMTDQVKAFASEFGVLPTEVVPALYSSLSAGVPQDNVFAFMETAQQLAKGGVTELETAVDGLSSVVNAYGADVLSAQEASDLMFTAVKGGKTTVDELASSLFQVTPTAAALGVKFGDVTAALATMTAAGVPTSVATTQLRQLFVEMSKEGSKTSAMFEELAGKSFKDFIAEGGNVQNALMILEDGAGELGVGIQDLFGSVEAGGAALALTGGNAEKFFNELNAGAESAGATQEAFETMNAGLAATMDRVKARLSVAMLGLGESLAPSIESIAMAVAGLLDVFAALPQPMQTGVILFGTLAAGALAFAGPMLKVIKLGGEMGKMFKLLAMNPWVAVALIIAGLAYLIITNWEDVSAFFVEFGEVVSEVWDDVYNATVGFATDVYDAVVSKFDEIGQFFIDWWPFIIGVFFGPLALIVALVVQHWDAILAKTTEIFGAVAGAVATAWNTVWSTTTSIGGQVVGFITGIPDKITGAFSTLAGIISAPFTAAFAAIKAAWNSTVGGFGFTTPGWIPGMGGKSFTIPSMAAGGVLTGPQMFLGGEYPGAGRNPEIVTPQNIMRETVHEAITSAGGTAGPTVQIVMNVDAGVTDPQFFERQATEIVRVVQRELDRSSHGSGFPGTRIAAG